VPSERNPRTRGRSRREVRRPRRLARTPSLGSKAGFWKGSEVESENGQQQLGFEFWGKEPHTEKSASLQEQEYRECGSD